MNHASLQRIQEVTAAQPGLFDSKTEQELEHGVTAAARRLFESKSWDVNGRFSTQDEQKAIRVLACLATGMSRRKIRALCGVHHYTIDAIDQAATKGGHLEPLRQRVRDAVARLALEAAEEVREALQSPTKDMDAAQWLKAAGFVFGVAIDKDQLLTGLPTEIIEQRSAPSRVDLEAWLQSQGMAVVSQVSAVDVQSPDTQHKTLMVNDCNPLNTQPNTEIALDSVAVSTPVEDSATNPGTSKGGGGGDNQTAPATQVDGSA